MIKIGKKAIGPGRPVFIIAEAGVNHNGRLDLALKMVDEAAKLQVDVVKFQTYITHELVTRNARAPKYQKAPANSQYDLLKKLELQLQMFKTIARHCRQRGIEFMSSPFDLPSLRFLVDEVKVKSLKIGSGEITNIPLVEAAAKTRIPVILSTGMSNMEEVRRAFRIFKENKAVDRLVLLHCVTQYPAPIDSLNLRSIVELEREFRVPVGYSDHSDRSSGGNDIAFAACIAVALGASIIEKHFTLDRRMDGPDQKTSANPKELEMYVKQVRTVQTALGDGRKRCQECEKEVRALARKSIVTRYAIAKGQKIIRDMLTTKRPGTGLAPDRMAQVVGRTASRDIPADTIINAGMFK